MAVGHGPRQGYDFCNTVCNDPVESFPNTGLGLELPNTNRVYLARTRRIMPPRPDK